MIRWLYTEVVIPTVTCTSSTLKARGDNYTHVKGGTEGQRKGNLEFEIIKGEETEAPGKPAKLARSNS